jgi:uncharacterized repeat protein (TIGR03803 family)
MSKTTSLAAAAWAAAATLAPAAANAQTFTTLYNGVEALGLTFAHGYLYGATDAVGNGEVFKFDIAHKVATVLHKFRAGDGVRPLGSLYYLNGSLYGATLSGGASGHGILFKVNATNGAEAIVYSFKGSPDGDLPNGSLIYENGVFYGTTQLGGTYGYGTVFKFDPVTNTETTLLSLDGAIGGSPMGALAYQNGVLYGAAGEGGGSTGCGTNAIGTCGTIYSLNPLTGGHRLVHAFQGGSEGGEPAAGVVDHAGVLYGTTEYYGSGNCGVVFAMGAFTGKETVLHNFDCKSDGGEPRSGLTYFGGSLYGSIGGYALYQGPGNVYKVDPATGDFSVLHSFSSADGYTDLYGVIQAGGKFFGSTLGNVLFELVP